MRSEAENNLQHILIKCITACEACAEECLNEADVKMMASCIKTDRDCADICALLSRYIARQSPMVKNILPICIEMCRKCGDECSKHEHWHCKKCAEICRECEEACKNYKPEFHLN